MATAKRFEDLESWQRARELAGLIYRLTSDGPWAKDYAFRDQIRRAGLSVMSNISEGFERRGPAEFARFLVIAKASAGEVRSQLYLALDLSYIDKTAFDSVFRLAERTSRMIASLINFLRGKGQSEQSAG